MRNEVFRFFVLVCSLIYPKLVQGERNAKFNSYFCTRNAVFADEMGMVHSKAPSLKRGRWLGVPKPRHCPCRHCALGCGDDILHRYCYRIQE